MNNQDVNKTIEVLNALIDIYARELYILDQNNSRDWKTQYQFQLKIDRTNQVIEELRKTI